MRAQAQVQTRTRLLTEEMKYCIVFYKEEEYTDTETAEAFERKYGRLVGLSTVSKKWAKYQQTGTVSNN